MLRETMKEYKKDAVKISLGWFFTSIMVVIFISFMIVMVEYAIPTQNIHLIIQFGILYFGVNILRSISTFFEDFSSDIFSKKIEADYREKIFIKLQKAKQIEMDQIKVGEILENILNDTKEIGRYFPTGIVRSYIGGTFRLGGTILVLAYLNIPIVTIAAVIYGIGFLITHCFNQKSFQYTEKKRNVNAKILNWSNEQIEGFQTIKNLEIQQQRMKELKKLISSYDKEVNQLEKNIRIYTNLYNFIISFIGVTNILMGGIGIIEGVFTYGSLIILVRYISAPETYAQWIIDGFQIRNNCKICYEKVKKVLMAQEENIEKGKELKQVNTIEMKEISFSYEENKKILNKISLKAQKGEKIALIGRTGSGKTSLVNLICRFYDLDSGEIKINGENYSQYSIQSLRDKIGYIMQKVVLIEGTVLENINYANKNISKEA